MAECDNCTAFLQPPRQANLRALFLATEPHRHPGPDPGSRFFSSDRTDDPTAPRAKTRTSVNFVNFGRENGAGLPARPRPNI